MAEIVTENVNGAINAVQLESTINTDAVAADVVQLKSNAEANAIVAGKEAEDVSQKQLTRSHQTSSNVQSTEDWLLASIKTYSSQFARPEFLDHRYEPECCGHRHIPGREGHNVPKDGSQCCYHVDVTLSTLLENQMYEFLYCNRLV